MKKPVLMAIAIVLVVALVIPVACSQPAHFELSALGISPAEVFIREEATVTAEVSNTGGAAGTYIATLKIDGVEAATREVTVPAGGQETVVFTVAEAVSGTYRVELDGLSGTLKVLRPLAEFKSAPILFEVPAGQTVECGYLTVPEDRS
jgi:hypothetical protein